MNKPEDFPLVYDFINSQFMIKSQVSIVTAFVSTHKGDSKSANQQISTNSDTPCADSSELPPPKGKKLHLTVISISAL